MVLAEAVGILLPQRMRALHVLHNAVARDSTVNCGSAVSPWLMLQSSVTRLAWATTKIMSPQVTSSIEPSHHEVATRKAGSASTSNSPEPRSSRPSQLLCALFGALPDAACDGPLGQQLRTRPVLPEDTPFLCDLFTDVRWEETEATGWSDDERRTFLEMQFRVQHRYYREHYPDGQFQLLLLREHPIGRLYWYSTPSSLALVDVSLVRTVRGAGIGSAILRWMTGQADARHQRMDLYVEPGNPARRLYERFGFSAEANNGIHLAMRRPPGDPLRHSALALQGAPRADLAQS